MNYQERMEQREAERKAALADKARGQKKSQKPDKG